MVAGTETKAETSSQADFGVITMAYGRDRYHRQAENLALSLRRHMPDLKLAIVTDRTDSAREYFDVAIPIGSTDLAGVIHKIRLYDFSPFQDTLFIDSDCLVAKPFHEEIERIRGFDFSPVCGRYLGPDDSDMFVEDLGTTLDALNIDYFPKFNGGIYYFRKTERARQVFTHAEDLYNRASELGIRNFDKYGPNDETLIGLALAMMGERDLYDDEGRFMRTPLGLQGALKFDAIVGKCSFNKSGVQVSPAICHFCGDWVNSKEYELADYALHAGKPPSLFVLGATYGRRKLGRLAQRLRGRVA